MALRLSVSPTGIELNGEVGWIIVPGDEASGDDLRAALKVSAKINSQEALLRRVWDTGEPVVPVKLSGSHLSEFLTH